MKGNVSEKTRMQRVRLIASMSLDGMVYWVSSWFGAYRNGSPYKTISFNSESRYHERTNFLLQSYLTVVFFPMHFLVILLCWFIFLLIIYRSLDNAEYLFPIDKFPFHFTMFLFLFVVDCLREI